MPPSLLSSNTGVVKWRHHVVAEVLSGFEGPSFPSTRLTMISNCIFSLQIRAVINSISTNAYV